MPRTDRITVKIFRKPLLVLAVCLSALVVFSTLGLDLINRDKGEKTYIFAARKVKPEPDSPSAKAKPRREKKDLLPLPKPGKKVPEKTATLSSP